MRIGAKYELPFKRRLEGKTDYRKRLALLKSGKPRLVIRKSLNHIRAQVVDFNSKGDKVLASASSEELKEFGWNYSTRNIPSSYLIGLLIGKRALKNKIKEVVVDIGLYSNVKSSRINSVVKGAIDSGLAIPYSSDVLPSEERIKGKHIIEYYKKIKSDKNKIQFSKNTPEKLEEMFEKVKVSIEKGVVNGEKEGRKQKESKQEGKKRKG